MKQDKADAILASIRPTLDYTGFDAVDIMTEAVIENINIKKAVLAEVEAQLPEQAVIATNTSSLLIEDLATALKRPQNFVGMHYFNPVPVMPLVEVIRGPKTSEEAVATAVAYANAMGKTPVVVKDCPGFLVNRIFTAYMLGFMRLVHDGADFEKVDQVMEAFGWPMGPAYLQDVIGMDTSHHVFDIIRAGYPERMNEDFKDALTLMAENKRYGQKNGLGFFRYEPDPKGKPKRLPAEDTRALLREVQPRGTRDFSDSEIEQRMMLPMIIDAAHCLESGVAEAAVEIDMSVILGIGFPRHLGGVLRYADLIGMREVVARCDRYAELGPLYAPTERMRAMAAGGEKFFQAG
jgi:3-hydroxyacyl-CoA dehydrogenase/enoyl-CoA hydratase/3-hydroxybutyryl-CoA epimerase/enoyl-CoA isomerase